MLFYFISSNAVIFLEIEKCESEKRENGKVGKLESWKVGKLESWQVEKLESWKMGKWESGKRSNRLIILYLFWPKH